MLPVIVTFFLAFGGLLAHDTATHKKITDAAVDYLSKHDERFSHPETVKRLKTILGEGAFEEDDKDYQWWARWNDRRVNARSWFHFLPRLKSSVAEGSCNSLGWAGGDCQSACPAQVCAAETLGILSTLTNEFRWWDAVDRAKDPTEGWRRLGYVLHLLEDLAGC